MNRPLLVSILLTLTGYSSGQNMCTLLPGEEQSRGQPVIFGQSFACRI
jgi:hypothetical protein